MDNMQDGVRFESLDYGAYVMEYEEGSYKTENVRYATADFNRLYTRKVRLPDGRGNVIWILSNSLESALYTCTNMIVPGFYRRFFYPTWSMGTFMKRKYKFSLTNKRERDAVVKEKSKFMMYQGKYVSQKFKENLVISADPIYTAVEPILSKLPIKRNYQEFFPEFVRILEGISPKKVMDSVDENGQPVKGKGPNWNNRILVIDCEAFSFKPSAPLGANKTNPLFLLYLAFLRHRDLSQTNIDVDMMICSKKMFMKFNPAKITKDKWQVFRRALFRIMDANLDDYTEQLSDEDKADLAESGEDKRVSNIVNNVVEPYTKNISGSTKAVLQHSVETQVRKRVAENKVKEAEIKNAQAEIQAKIHQDTSKPNSFKRSLAGVPEKKVDPRLGTLFQRIDGTYHSLTDFSGIMIDDDDERPTDSDWEQEVEDDAQDVMINDPEVAEEVLDEIQDRVAPIRNNRAAPINSARDKKLREEQKQVVVGNETIEQILERDSSNVPIKVEDKSAVMHTSNKNMHQIRFANFDKTYIDELYMKDIVACFDILKDKEYPLYVTGVEVKDTSTNLDFKDTWTVTLKDTNNKKHTIKVDLPKFQNDRFMLINGTRYIVLKQNFYNPLVKDSPNVVILTTNHQKVTITRKGTKSLSSIDRIFRLIKRTGDQKMFITGDSSKSNMKYISTLEYDELSRRLFRFTTKQCQLCFSRDYILEHMEQDIPSDIKGDEFFIGTENGFPILINEDTGRDRRGRTIIEIIEENLPDNYRAIYNEIKSPKQAMYVDGKLCGKRIPIIATLIVWNGIRKTLDKMNIKWEFMPNVRRMPADSNTKHYIRFADGILEYESVMFAELIMNGLIQLHPENFKFDDFESEVGYGDYIYATWGSFNAITQLKRFNECLIDPITKQVCKDMMLPDDPSGLVIHAVKLLSDNACVSKASDTSYRVRSLEVIPVILYRELNKQYQLYVDKNMPFTLKQNCVLSGLVNDSNMVKAYSTLNPVTEMHDAYHISAKGYKGSNSEDAYRGEEKRSYDPSSVGKIAISTSADGNVGVNKSLVVEPTITNARGYREAIDESEIKDVNVFSPVEMLTPGTARRDDPIRTAIACKQSGHIVPVSDASPALISNGYDEAVQFYLSDDFVINAEEDGEVIEINDDAGFMVVKYKSGKTRAINIQPEIVKNSNSAFYLANKLKPTHTKVGEKFKKDEPLAYHDKYFRYSKLNGLRFSIGPLVKMAFMSSYNTYEDAGICTAQLAERMKTSIVYQERLGKFKRNNNILSIVKVGDHVNIGDSLIKFDVAIEDNEISKFISKLNDENAELLTEESKSEIKSMHAGTVVAIKVYTLLDPSELSPSLGAIVQQYFDKGTTRKKFLEKYDQSVGTMKAGYLLTDSTEPVKSRYNTIKGIKGIDVLIEIYVEHDDVLGIGDKVALYGPNKQIISEVIPKGYEPYSEFRPDEEISVLTSPGTIARRMTASVIAISAAFKCMIELKRKIRSEIKYK